MKKTISLVLIISIALLFCSCFSDSLNGTYTSESGLYSIEFNKDGSCTWYQDGMFFDGTYEKTEAGWQLDITGSGFYPNTVFQAVEDGNDLVITGGIVNGETFVKE